MTFLEMQDAVIGARFDVSQRTSVKRWINQRYTWLWAQHDWPFKKNAIANLVVVSGNSTPASPAGLKSVNRIYDNLGAEVHYLSPYEFDNFYTNSTSTGKPYHYTVINKVIFVGPKPDADYTFKIAFESRCTHLVADASRPTFPEEWDPILVVGGIAAGLREENDPTAPGVDEEFQFLYQAMTNELLPPDATSPRQIGRDNL